MTIDRIWQDGVSCRFNLDSRMAWTIPPIVYIRKDFTTSKIPNQNELTIREMYKPNWTVSKSWGGSSLEFWVATTRCMNPASSGSYNSPDSSRRHRGRYLCCIPEQGASITTRSLSGSSNEFINGHALLFSTSPSGEVPFIVRALAALLPCRG